MNAPRPLTRDELVDIFWQSDAPLEMSKFASMFRALFYRKLPFEPVTIKPDYDALCDLSKLHPSEAIFTMAGQPFGETIYIAVLCGRHVIVPPFPIEQRENLPNMFPTKEAPRATSADTTDAALTSA